MVSGGAFWCCCLVDAGGLVLLHVTAASAAADTVAGVLATVVLVVVVAVFLDLPLLKKLRSRIATTKTATAIAAFLMVRLRRCRFSSASRASRAIRAFSFLRWRLSAVGTAAECTGRRNASVARRRRP